MPFEIERKFLVTSQDWKPISTPTEIIQGYLSRDPDRIVRVRLRGDQAFLTVKGRPTGITRTEIEFPISVEEARAMFPLCLAPLIEKTRHELPIGPHVWEIDEFHGINAGLIVAEIELSSEDEPFERPSWLGQEVSHDRRYSNSHLSQNPFSTWSEP